MIFYADLGINVDVGGVDDMEARVEQFLDALAELEESDPAIQDVDITATLATGDITVNMCLRADDLAGAGQKIVATVRTSLHDIGDGTAGWEHLAQLVHEACMNVRASSVRELAGA
ncbi:hypothetical protein [Actinomadura algeriensis]|uniref:Uncharacterized protein n=1 Tax=Actinomadura algeriensis TaxID=1679523 RepID=A0ABR9JRT3_9ACTN|nr:hypothetical protein [Actinomadura algeriensis]MBE1533285.1 hypothetical protein [Actinomadura algeriensis]